MARILIADDHAVVRAGYRQFLEFEPAVTEIGEAATGKEALEKLRLSSWQLLLLDIQMPDRNGIEMLHEVIATYSEVPVLIMSGLPEAQYARNALRVGARGYLSKTGDMAELLKAVRVVLSGRRYISASLAEAMAADVESAHGDDQPLHARLSTRELQIFRRLAVGVGVTAIAGELSLSVKTVSTYRSRILEKMNFKTNADITGYALRNGLI